MTIRMFATMIGALAAVTAAGLGLAQGEARRPGAGAAGAAGQESAPPQKPADDGGEFPDLLAGLKATPGCLGVEAAQTMSGKNVIFAWFEDKKAVKAWFYSDMHVKAMDRYFPGQDHGKPMENVPDDVGPIMAIASITMADAPQFNETNLPVSQMAIELYTPITGGLFLGERFAPEGVKVKEMADYTPRPSDEPAEKPSDKPAGKPAP
jgi:hypothetical protein